MLLQVCFYSYVLAVQLYQFKRYYFKCEIHFRSNNNYSVRMRFVACFNGETGINETTLDWALYLYHPYLVQLSTGLYLDCE